MLITRKAHEDNHGPDGKVVEPYENPRKGRIVMMTKQMGIFRRALAVAAVSAFTLTALPALAELKGLEILAPANSGGGYDQHARALQQVMQELNLASGVQVMNVPGAGGTIGLVGDGDRILIDIPNRAITLLVTDDELTARRREQDARGWKPAQPRPRKVTGALKAYALLATSADKGAVRNLAALDA